MAALGMGGALAVAPPVARVGGSGADRGSGHTLVITSILWSSGICHSPTNRKQLPTRRLSAIVAPDVGRPAFRRV